MGNFFIKLQFQIINLYSDIRFSIDMTKLQILKFIFTMFGVFLQKDTAIQLLIVNAIVDPICFLLSPTLGMFYCLVVANAFLIYLDYVLNDDRYE